MKCAVFYVAALACCIGLALADWDSLGYGSSLGYGYGGGYGGAKAAYVPYYPGGGATGRGVGNGGFLAMIGLLFLLFFIFGNNNNNQDQILLINSTLEG